MPIYNYKAKTSPDTFRTGSIEAESEKAAASKLKLLNYHPISIRAKIAERSKYNSFINKIKTKDIYIFVKEILLLFIK